MKIWLSPPYLSGKEKEYLQQAVDSGWLSSTGPHIKAFEKALAEKLKTNYVVCLNSGTSAIHLALKILNVQQNDEVICPSLTFAATANPVLYEKAIPIFVDSEPTTWNLSPEWLEVAIQDRIRRGKKPKAIIVVHLYGNSASIETIQAIARNYEIPLIEDNAEAFGAQYQNSYLGTWGDLGVLSFNGNKIITTSAGGALICPSEEHYQQAYYLAHQAKSPAPFYHHEAVGYNYAMSNLLAALGLAQLENLNERIRQKRYIFQRYWEALIQPYHLPYPKELPESFSIRWLSVFLLPENTSPHELIQVLGANEIEARRVWKPLHTQPVFEQFPFYGEHLCQTLFERGICLPSGLGLTPEQQNQIIQIVKDFLG